MKTSFAPHMIWLTLFLSAAGCVDPAEDSLGWETYPDSDTLTIADSDADTDSDTDTDSDSDTDADTDTDTDTDSDTDMDTDSDTDTDADVPPCTDTPPDSAYTCAQQAEWGKCSEAWMTGFCEQTCGNCTPSEDTDTGEDKPLLFITRSEEELLDGDEPFRFVSFNIPNLHIVEDPDWHRVTAFEQEDAVRTVVEMGGTVIRVYTFAIKGGVNNGWGASHYYGPGQYDEALFTDYDRMIKIAGDNGVRLIIPFIDNWSWFGGKTEFANLNGGGDFYTSGTVKQAFKDFVSYILNRRNTLTGRAYKDEPAILAWETGNELGGVPDAWTREIAEHIKSIDPNHLVMDGVSYPAGSAPVEASLNNDYIDIVSAHYYANDVGDYTAEARADAARAAGRKPFVIGEYGCTGSGTLQAVMNETVANFDIAGSLIWSLRFHAENGGFYWHNDLGYKSYHWPGFPSNSVSDEVNILRSLREKAFAIRGLSVPPMSRPNPPVIMRTGTTIRWKGSVGGHHYILERASAVSGPWTRLSGDLSDATEPYQPYTDASGGNGFVYRMKAVNAEGLESDWSALSQ